MAFIQCNFFSETLSISTAMNVILPENTTNQIGMKSNRKREKIPVLYLLHGFSDDHTIWTRRTSIERYAASYGIAVIMPQVDHSFYTDMEYGKKYWTFLSEELPRVAQSFFPISDKREDNFVAGLSMGGYGAFKWALRKPEMFAAAASLSGALDIVGHLEIEREFHNPIEQALYHVFGERDIEETEEDLFYLVKRLKKEGAVIPELFQACGTEDFLFEENQKFLELAKKYDVPITTTFSPGEHEWDYWDQTIQEVLEWLPLSKNE
ncbi:S-formylglutathione hydrolase FrmB [Gracilibacillus halotolerans]|uniref:S-formylglutathione hydrolase FrmB n=1 Tax=Gracilibacillus halotolerans TaxID=74386 RepID=A0A841RMS2_9BACI|nr:alpha/beta hydrolase family protein [Gracilibacillus halotolerans]MBB6513192.1 S-formylglutathione hydrolase FrmB [Gracilibacillus halotolerans]